MSSLLGRNPKHLPIVLHLALCFSSWLNRIEWWSASFRHVPSLFRWLGLLFSTKPEMGALGHDGAEVSLPAKIHTVETKNIASFVLLQ